MSGGERTRITGDGWVLPAAHGRGMVILGLAAAAAGTLPLLRATEVITAGRVNAPLWLVGYIGGLFVAVGLLAIFKGLAGARRQSRWARARAEAPDEPETWEYPFGGCELSDQGLRRALRGTTGTLVLGAFLVPFVWWGFFSRDGSVFVQAGTGLFVALFLVCIGCVAFQIGRVMRFGQGRLRLPRFPLRPGETAMVELQVPGDQSMLERVRGTLRFVEDRWEVQGQGESQTQQRVRYALWQHSFDVAPPGGVARGLGGIELPLPFPPEARDLVTAISAVPIRYWELEVRGLRPGLDYLGCFLLPVYGCEPVAEPSPGQVTSGIDRTQSLVSS